MSSTFPKLLPLILLIFSFSSTIHCASTNKTDTSTSSFNKLFPTECPSNTTLCGNSTGLCCEIWFDPTLEPGQMGISYGMHRCVSYDYLNDNGRNSTFGDYKITCPNLRGDPVRINEETEKDDEKGANGGR